MQHAIDSFVIEKPYLSGKRISVADFGAKAEKGICNTQAFRKAIDACQKLPGTRLDIPKGVYHFYNAPDNVHIPLQNISDTLIDGHGSELIFHTPVAYWDLADCNRIHLKNMIFDWAWDEAPLATVGVIKQVARDGSFIDVVFPSAETVPSDMEIRIVGPFDPKRYTPGFPGGIEFRPYRNTYIHLAGENESDEKMQHLVRELSNILLPQMEKLYKDELRIYTRNPAWAAERFLKGQCYNFRHFEYDGVAVRTTRSSHITMENLTIYGCPGSGFFSSGGVHHLHFDRCRIMPRPGTARSISVSVDCLHVGNSQGHLLIEGCDFSFAGDDCINLHDNSSMGVRRLGSHRLLALRVTESAMQLSKGSEIELRNPDLSPTGYFSRVNSVLYHPNERTCELALDKELPENLDKHSVIFHRSFHTDHYIIRNCRFTNNRARGALLQGSHGLVENNVFENIQGAAIQIETGCESRWSEGQGVDDLLIRRNIIRHCDLNAWQMAVIYMGVYLPNGRTDYPVFTRVELYENTIVDCPRLAGFFSSCQNVEFHHNTIINAGQMDLSLPCYGSSTMETPIYNEHYEGIVQFSHSSSCSAYDNHIFSTIL
jgi:hypothetical protein